MVWSLDLGQISFNLVEDAFATRQLALLSPSIAFYDMLAWACAEIKILRREGDLRLYAFGFLNFFSFPFSPFLFLFAAVIDLLLGLPAVKKLLRKRHVGGQFLPLHGAARCSGSKFCSEFFTQLFEHFVHISASIRPITLIWA